LELSNVREDFLTANVVHPSMALAGIITGAALEQLKEPNCVRGSEGLKQRRHAGLPNVLRCQLVGFHQRTSSIRSCGALGVLDGDGNVVGEGFQLRFVGAFGHDADDGFGAGGTYEEAALARKGAVATAVAWSGSAGATSAFR
jgi:hypothetical protein